MLKGLQNDAKMDADAAVGSQLLDFGSQNLQNIAKTASKIYEKSELRRGCVFGAVLDPFLEHVVISTVPVWRPFSTKNRTKRYPKRYPKIDAEKVSRNSAKIMPT